MYVGHKYVQSVQGDIPKSFYRYNIRHWTEFLTRPANGVYYGTKPLASLRPKVWELVPGDSSNAEFLEDINSAIKIGSQKVPLNTF